MKRRIAYVEDNEDAREVYARLLRDVGFEVATYGGKDEAIASFRGELPDLALLDISHRGDRDAGYEICAELRRISTDIPIIFLTNRHGEVDKISGFRLGADDYISKDASLDYVLVRIEALFRRLDAIQKPQSGDGRIVRGDLEIDTDRMTVSWQEQSVGLTLTEFWMVYALARHPGHVKSRQQLMDAANVVLDDNSITSHIKRIRRKFKAIDDSFDKLDTVYGAGYRWNGSAD